jgi:2-C-methyl-D-erythritol 4-phosphate cytidylyltransferase
VRVAAGAGRRFGRPKQFALLKGRRVLDRTLEKFQSHGRVDEIVLVLADLRRTRPYMRQYGKIRAVVRGGRHRQDSVLNGVLALEATDKGIVLVHDGVRPLVSKDLIDRVIESAGRFGAAVPVLPIDDTVKEVRRGRVVRTLERDRLFRTQTPQGFSYRDLLSSLKSAARRKSYFTDEAALFEKRRDGVAVVEGEAQNIKITTREDLRLAEALLGS